MFILFTVAFYIITLHIYFIYFCNEIPLKRNLANQVICKFSVRNSLIILLRISGDPSFRYDKQRCRKSENDAPFGSCTGIFNPIYLLARRKPGRHSFASEILSHLNTRIMLYEDPGANASGCGALHVAASGSVRGIYGRISRDGWKDAAVSRNNIRAPHLKRNVAFCNVIYVRCGFYGKM